MSKIIYLSLACVAILHGAEELQSIEVVDQVNTQIAENVSGEEVKSADLAEALTKKFPSVSLIRRSGIANDIILRGQKRDNINVTVDGAKICGACVNRMDPPTSHVVTHAIDEVEIQEGPFDVEEFGTLSGIVKVKTLKPSQEVSGEVSLGVGSFDYKKASGTISGGTDKVRVLFSASKETGGAYRDGNGDNFAEQLSNYTATRPDLAGSNYAPKYADKDAFEKSMMMGKLFVDVAEDQELRFSYSANRSDDILYPSTKMDAIWDDSDILNMEYTAKNLGRFSKQFDIQVYNSQVDHPMSTQYRAVALKMGKYMTNHLTTDMTGLKLKNSVDAFGRTYTYGVDMSKRNWDGTYTMTTVDGSAPVMTLGKGLDDVDTDNVGFFAKCERTIGKVDFEIGARFDDTQIDTQSVEKDTDFQSFSGNLFATYNADGDTKYFAGFGKSNRVPDARELYNVKYNTKVQPAVRVLNGNPDLEQTTNYEADLGVEQYYLNGKIKAKTFYSKLKDYIYYNGSVINNNFENIDATIYGAELSGSYLLTDAVSLDAGLAYKKGRKDTLPTGESDHDLADISPLKVNAAVAYDYDDQGNVELSVVAADKWTAIDSENGEQELGGYGVLNFKTTREFDNGVLLIAGVDNLLDKNYAITNTYKDLTLVSDGSDTMLINEPGRYLYFNATYRF